MKKRGRRGTQEEHTKWSCLILWAAAALLFIDNWSRWEFTRHDSIVQCSHDYYMLHLSTVTMLQLAAATIHNSLCRPRLNGWLDWVHASAATTTRHEKASMSMGNYLSVPGCNQSIPPKAMLPGHETYHTNLLHCFYKTWIWPESKFLNCKQFSKLLPHHQLLTLFYLKYY